MTVSEREGTVDLFWLASALDHARSLNQTDIVYYLQYVAEDMVFQMEMAARRVSLLSRVM